MSNYKNLAAIGMAAMLSFGLVACGGGGGGSGPGDTDEIETPDPAIAQLQAVTEAADAAEMAVAALTGGAITQEAIDIATATATALDDALMLATDIGDTEKAAYTRVLGTVQGAIANAGEELAADMAEAERDRLAEEAEAERVRLAEEAAAQVKTDAMAKKLFAGLGVDVLTLAATAGVSLTGGEIVLNGLIDPDGAGGDQPAAIPEVTLPRSGAVVPSIPGWNGGDYIKTASGVTNHAVAYTNPEPPEEQAFEAKHGGIIANGQVPETDFGDFKISGADFASGAGDKLHPAPTGADYVSVRGTFDGANGSFRCDATSTCRSSVDDDTGVALSGTWVFIADDGAKTSTPDADYLLFGWWARDTGSSVAIVPFVGTVGTPIASTDIQALSGEATYSGGATGKVAVYDPLVSSGNVGGVFTAAATLTAKFGSATEGGTISGTIDKFSVDGVMHDWSVALKKATIVGSGSATFGGESARTVWSIGETPAAESGQWSGAFYDTASSNVPATAAGTFTSEYGNVGRMAAAFGATNDKK